MFDMQRFLPSRRDNAPQMPPLPDEDLYVIGDIHGAMGALEDLLGQIDQDVARQGRAAARLVFVGDYVDRGEDSAAVLRRLKDLDALLPGHVTCLMGNHERMLLAFLDNPIAKGRRWFRHGGLQTLASFGISGIRETALADDLCDAADALRRALSDCDPGLLDWLRHRPLSFHSGNVFVSHAGADPALALIRQTERALLWGAVAPDDMARSDDTWVVHGHFAAAAVRQSAGVIGVDSDVVQTGRLSCIALRAGAAPRVLVSGGGK